MIEYSSRWLIDFINTIPMGLYRTTLEGKFEFCNRPVVEMFGCLSREELMACSVIDLYWDKKRRGEFVKAVLKNDFVSEFPIALKRKDGSKFWCSITAGVVRDDDGLALYFDGVLREIEKEIEEKEKMAQEKLQGVLEMAGGVAHSLNQPLMIINNLYRQVMAEMDPKNQNYERMERISRQVMNLNKIVKKIGYITKYETIDYVGGESIVNLDSSLDSSASLTKKELNHDK